jgi:hypothetical protein
MSKIDLATKTKAELLKIAQRFGLRGISTLNKADLVQRVRHAQQRKAGGVQSRPSGIVAVAKQVADAIKRRAVRKRAERAATPKPSAKPDRLAARPAGRSPISAPPAKEQPVVERAPEELSAHKFDVSPAQPPPKQAFVDEHLGELPEAYGSGRLFLAARDPHWLYAYWDLSWQQMADYRGQSSDGRLLLRVYEMNHAKPVQELTLGHDTRNWYIPVNKAATTYSVELGFWRHDGSFHTISRSREATTAPDAVSTDTTARFVTIPIDCTFRELVNLIRDRMKDGEALAEALRRLQVGNSKLPFKVALDLGPWSEEQARKLERMLGGDVLRRIRMGSFEITEWLRRRLQEELSSGMFSAFSPAGASWSGAPQKGFWFAVNAELIIYGATEPGAKVTIDDKPIDLRSDGTFSFHYTFPDGQYRLPVVAVSAAGDDSRAVELSFERRSKTEGAVGKVKEPADLKAPAVA